MTDEIQEQYQLALQALIAKVQADATILAAILLGSLAYDTVWRRSDIDLLLVTQETRRNREGLCLVEAGVNIHCFLTTRSEFRRILEGSVEGSFVHSLLVKGSLLFSREEPLGELFEARHRLGDRDRSIQFLRTACQLLPVLTKAEKWFYTKRDFDYCSYWILKCVDALATLEVLRHGEIPGREVVHRALAHNPALFHVLYTDLLHGHATEASLQKALLQMQDYLLAHRDIFFEPIFSYLREEGTLRSMTDINHHFHRHFNLECVDTACEWLAEEGFLQKFATPTRLTEKSRVDVEEAAYSLSEGEQR